MARNLTRVLPDSGVEVGRSYHATTFDVLGHAFPRCATMRDIFDTALHYLDLRFAFTDPRRRSGTGGCSSPSTTGRCCRRLAVPRRVRPGRDPSRGRRAGARGVPALEVSFRFPEHADTSHYDFGM
ncbi:hypothetical protein GCM10027184_69190 [Saccharothrix stipae]